MLTDNFILRHRPPEFKSKNRCPYCDSDYDAIAYLLKHPKYSAEWQEGIQRANDCHGCRTHFVKEMK